LKKKTPRAICLEILNRIEKADRHPDRLLSDSFKRYRYLTSLDRSFLTELTYGALRWKGKLDWVLQQFSKVPLEKIEIEILNVLRIGLYQILFLSRTPVSAAVNESVELAKRFRGKGGAGFVNAILRLIARGEETIRYPDFSENPALHISIVQSHPLWLVRRWIEDLGAEVAAKVCTGNNRIAPLTLRTNTLKTDREQLVAKLKAAGLKPFPTDCSEEGILLNDSPPVSELPFLKEGLYVIQDEASQLVTSILGPRPSERVLDACAGPGGKTTHIAQRMQNRGEVYAVDLNRRKLNLIGETCTRLGVTIVTTVKGDASQELSVSEGLKFDRILADVPCSGFGTLRRNPDLKWRKGEDDIVRLSKLQSSILNNLSTYLRRGGILVYSTCTVFREENEDVVEKFLGDHPDFQLEEMVGIIPKKCFLFVRGQYFKTFPQEGEMDGFFVARLFKTVHPA
jgi:16S rRNA (cytosine967-C5)-methyltransferase